MAAEVILDSSPRDLTIGGKTQVEPNLFPMESRNT